MQRGTKEFYELIKQFEIDIIKMPFYVSIDLTRDHFNDTTFYQNGEINRLFHAYMFGYQNAKCLARLGEFEVRA